MEIKKLVKITNKICNKQSKIDRKTAIETQTDKTEKDRYSEKLGKIEEVCWGLTDTLKKNTRR